MCVHVNIAKFTPGRINVSFADTRFYGVFAYVPISIGQIIVSTAGAMHLGKRSFVIGRPCARHKETVLALAARWERSRVYLYRNTWRIRFF